MNDERYWAKVDKSGNCWLWTGYRDSRGYGQVQRGGKVHYAHRYALVLAGLESDGHVDHICHTKSCVRPEHLRYATNKQNHENLKGAYRNSKSGVRGVYWDARCQQWAATVGHGGRKHFKRFATLAEAEAWASATRADLFTHSEMDR